MDYFILISAVNMQKNQIQMTDKPYVSVTTPDIISALVMSSIDVGLEILGCIQLISKRVQMGLGLIAFFHTNLGNLCLHGPKYAQGFCHDGTAQSSSEGKY